MTQKSTVLIHFAAEAWSDTSSHDFPHAKRHNDLFVFIAFARKQALP